MKSKKELTRNTIIQTLAEALEPLDYIFAFYEGGAAAFNRIDEYSDIDLYLVVDDKKVAEAFLTVEKTLKSLSAIEQKLDVPQTPWPGVSQAFYRLKDANQYLLIDLAVLTLNCPEKFLDSSIHGNVVFYFNKFGKVKHVPLDNNDLSKKLQQRLERLKLRFGMFNNFVQKEINRGNLLEAIDLYHVLTLGSLVEVLRIRHNPVHHDFKMRYVHYELPSGIIKNLEHLYFVKDGEDLQKKYCEASKWFNKVISETIKHYRQKKKV